VKIRLDKKRLDPVAWREVLTIPAASLERSELEQLSPVSCEGVVEKADPGFLLRARLSYERTLVCDRCLKPYVESIAEPLETMLVAGGDSDESGERQLGEDDFGLQRVEGEDLETEGLVREQVLLSLPAKPLCRPDCAGLCPRCGADLASEPCRCSAEPDDGHWPGLAALRERLASGGEEGKH